MESFNIHSTKDLRDHDSVLRALFQFFSDTPGVIGCYLSGSTVTGCMDEDSDLDIGVVYGSASERKAAWETRWDWEIAPWFHRMDADHIKPYFVIYFFEPQIKADINLYIAEDLPPYEGGPYEIVWDDTGALEGWQDGLTEPQDSPHDWREVVHEDERFWAWIFYLYSHVHRGEYYHSAYEFPAIRDILEKWAARLGGYSFFNSRHLEDHAYADQLKENDLFPKPDRESMRVSMLDAIQVQLSLRRKIAKEPGITWNTTDDAIEKFVNLVNIL